jgi:hypothetical protein
MSTVRIVANVGLDDTATNDATLITNEPTVAQFGDEIYVTGNLFSSYSNDGGATWAFVDPSTALPTAAGGFCCDQIVAHERSRNLWFWVLQYNRQAGSNVLRVALSTSGRPTAPWTFWDFAPATFNNALAGNGWFDYPDVAFTDNMMYITSNVYDNATPQANWLQSVVIRIPIDTFLSGNITYQYYNITDHGSLKLARGCTNEMFFASHTYGNPIRVYRWGDGAAATLTFDDINASAWTGSGTFSSPGPGGIEWLTHSDSRITAGWCSGNQVGFAWTAHADGSHPQPYIKTLVINTTDKSVVAEPDLWNSTQAWAYPAVYPAPDGRVGISAFFGGGNVSHPAHIVGFLENGSWIVARTATSTHGPNAAVWGDYLSCSLYDPTAVDVVTGTDWVATGFTMQGGSTRNDVEPRYVRFGVGP